MKASRTEEEEVQKKSWNNGRFSLSQKKTSSARGEWEDLICIVQALVYVSASTNECVLCMQTTMLVLSMKFRKEAPWVDGTDLTELSERKMGSRLGQTFLGVLEVAGHSGRATWRTL